MDWIQRIENAIDYVEENITEKINYEDVAKRAYSSSFHFQKVFSIMSGLTLGEYIRRRKLTLAGSDLLTKKMKVIDVAFKYGYETSESFSRAFYKFHAIMPSQVKNGCYLKSFSRLSFKPDFIRGSEMTYKIEEKSEIILVGYKKRFTGVPYGEERVKQEEAFLTSTRAKQWLLIGASCDYSTDYMVVTNIDDDGYDFYVAYELDEWTRKELFNPKVTGVDFMDKMDFEIIVIPKQTYVVFETEKKNTQSLIMKGYERRLLPSGYHQQIMSLQISLKLLLCIGDQMANGKKNDTLKFVYRLKKKIINKKQPFN